MKLFIAIFTFCISILSCSGQSLFGVVADYDDKAISGVHIINISNKLHTHSNENGKFELLDVDYQDTLKFTHIGYKTTYAVVDSLNTPMQVFMKESLLSIDEIVITPQVSALNLIADINIQTNPVNSSQDILRQVPGLIIGQHAGGGKAEQIFLRGFDVDHGTDVAITVDGMPVNMISHAHGQGYADLHFIIPETVNKIDFGKGPYYASVGNFNTAGFVNFNTLDRLENSALKFELGQFNTNRLVGMFNLIDSDVQSGYVSTEYLSSDGPFDSPQNFDRLNLFGKYNRRVNSTDKIGFTFSHFTSKWDASGQIPQRLVDDGTIGRFGAVDSTEGGNTSRTNLQLHYTKFINEVSYVKNRVYYSDYTFELYSNFTFFLEDPENGDQIRQKENRSIFGLSSEYNHSFDLGESEVHWQLGGSVRNDEVKNNELSYTINRKELIRPIQLGDVNETNFSGYINAKMAIGKWMINPSIRVEKFKFQYNDKMLTNYLTQSESKSMINPKLNVFFNYTQNFQAYFKMGKGFHSNDTRVVVAQNGREILPGAFGSDLGIVWKPKPRLLMNLAYWYLFSEQEFVYVGDAGIVEPSGRSRRHGVDLSLRYQTLGWLFLNLDANYAIARSIDEDPGNDYIPLAPNLTVAGGAKMIRPTGLFAGFDVRYIRDRPANENNSIIAEGYTVVDVSLGHNFKSVGVGIQIQNALNVDWNETQFATTSRLKNEDVEVEEIHFTPGTPFFIKGTIEYKF